jgi:hypothetical protein
MIARDEIMKSVGLVILVLSLTASVHSQETKQIPLDQIWGYNLPGTRDIAGIPLPEHPQPGVGGGTEAEVRLQREADIERLRRALVTKPPAQNAPRAFVLPRQPDWFTLKNASSRIDRKIRQPLVTEEIESETFRAGESMTLVFFSHPASYYVRLRKVERNANEITVQYEFVPHGTVEVTVHFALIPLGRLPAGEYQVRFKQIALSQTYRVAGFEPVASEAFEIICRPFSFTMWEPTTVEEDPPAKDAKLIPLDQIWAYEMPGTRDIRELEPLDVHDPSFKELYSQSRLRKIARFLSTYVPESGAKAPPAFVVIGEHKEALSNASAVFSKQQLKQTKNQSVPRDTNLFLVFYSYVTGWQSQINSIERSSNQITVRYQFISPREPSAATPRFALIPIGKLSPGRVQVEIKELPPVDYQGEPVMPTQKSERFVCGSFSFDVQ